MLNKFLFANTIIILLFSACGTPKALFTADTKKAVAPAIISFSNQSELGESYIWNFGDDSTSTDSIAQHRFRKSGNYEVSLTAIKGNKKNTYTQTIQIIAPKKCLVEIETSFGNMLIELFDYTPQHRDNFIKLAEDKFYDGLLFHRVINGFMVQGGDPESRGADANKRLGGGGPGYTIPAEINIDSFKHVKGALAAARTGNNINPERASSGSQYYIVDGKRATGAELNQIEMRRGFKYTQAERVHYLDIGGAPFLDGEYTVFGRVLDGMEVIDKIAKQKTDKSNRPLEDISMKMHVIN